MNNEYYEQVAVTNYLRYKYPTVLWTASAGGMRVSIGTAIKMKNAGYAKGTPDIMIFEPRAKFCGLFIELKRGKGTTKISTEQKDWIIKLRERGYFALVCEGYDEARNTIDKYLDMDNNKAKAF